jgi:hypothetical protein
MSKAKPKAGGINPALLNALDAELEALDETGDDGKRVYGLADRLSIIDRAIKLEQLKLKLDDGAEGSQFGNEEGDNDE